MLNAIKQFFDRNMQPGTDEVSSTHQLQLATAALLIEMTRMDDHVKEEERRVVVEAVQTKFGLTEEETASLVALAQAECRDATDYFQFTSLINGAFTYEQKEKVIEYLWQVAYADGDLDPYEEHLVRKIADLLYISHKEFIAAKFRARHAMGEQ